MNSINNNKIFFTAAPRGVLFEEYLNKFEWTRNDQDRIRLESGNTYCRYERTNVNAN